jgi:transcriptional regulator with XRE-family HTH domain
MTWNPFGVAFGRALAEIRKKKRITQRGFAEKTGVIAPFCSAVERANFTHHNGLTYNNEFVGRCFAEGLGLTGCSADRLVAAFVVSREMERMQKRDGWLGAVVVYVRMLLEQEPDLSPILWPAIQLVLREPAPRPHLRLVLVEEAELVTRTRQYILGEHELKPPGIQEKAAA